MAPRVLTCANICIRKYMYIYIYKYICLVTPQRMSGLVLQQPRNSHPTHSQPNTYQIYAAKRSAKGHAATSICTCCNNYARVQLCVCVHVCACVCVPLWVCVCVCCVWVLCVCVCVCVLAHTAKRRAKGCVV